MNLYGHPQSSCTRKVVITLAEKAHHAALIDVDLFAGEHKQPPHLARHPFGLIPVLDDDGFVVYESRAIVRYLEVRLPGPRLVPATPRALARMEQSISVEQSYVSPEVRVLVRNLVVAPALGAAPDPDAIAAARSALDRALGVIDASLAAGPGPFLAGADFSLADVCLMPYVGALPKLGAGNLVGARPHLASWWERVAARPSWRAIEARS